VYLDGRPVSGAEITLRQAGHIQYVDFTKSGADGRFLAKGFKGYDYYVTASYDIWYNGRADAPAGTDVLEISLQKRQ
jgi:hypothetical protein